MSMRLGEDKLKPLALLSQKCPIRPESGTLWWDTLLLYPLYLTPFVPLSHHILKTSIFVPFVSQSKKALPHSPKGRK